MFREEEQEAEVTRAIEKMKRTGKPMEIDSRGRHVMPRYPLLTGIWNFRSHQASRSDGPLSR